MRYKSTHKEETREKVVALASATIRSKGIGGISVAGLMAEAGLTHGGFYLHFPTKEALVEAAVAHAFQASRALLLRHLDGADPATGLAGLIDAYLSERAFDAPDRSCPIPSLAGEVTRLPEALRRHFAEGYALYIAGIGAALEALGRPDPATLAGSLMAEMVGSMGMARVIPDREQSLALLAAARVRLKVRVMG